jgi:hypothetical protein
VAGINAPAHGFHRDTIRIPMMAFSLGGALVTFYILWQVHRLRNRSAARWRVKPVTAHQRNSKRLQLVLSIVTLILLEGGWLTHPSFTVSAHP